VTGYTRKANAHRQKATGQNKQTGFIRLRTSALNSLATDWSPRSSADVNACSTSMIHHPPVSGRPSPSVLRQPIPYWSRRKQKPTQRRVLLGMRASIRVADNYRVNVYGV